MRQKSASPTRKVQVGALSGAISTVIVFLVEQYGIQIPAAVASAITTIVTFLISYSVPPSEQDDIVPQ